MVDHFLAAADAVKPRSDEWKKGPKLTMQDLLNGRGVERISREELKSGKSSAQSVPSKSAHVFAFGKHRGELILDVWGSDPGYVKWAMNEVDGFREKAIAAGIEEDDL